MKLLEVKNLSLSFKSKLEEKQVLKNISFTLNKSKTLGIVGESGSGKSLTALSVINLLPKDSLITRGEVNFYEDNDVINILRLNQNELQELRGKNISMIFQEPMTSLNPSLKCGYQVQEILLSHTNLSTKDSKKRVIEL